MNSERASKWRAEKGFKCYRKWDAIICRAQRGLAWLRCKTYTRIAQKACMLPLGKQSQTQQTAHGGLKWRRSIPSTPFLSPSASSLHSQARLGSILEPCRGRDSLTSTRTALWPPSAYPRSSSAWGFPHPPVGPRLQASSPLDMTVEAASPEGKQLLLVQQQFTGED